MGINDLFKKMGLDPDKFNENQKNIFGKASEDLKEDDGQKAKQWTLENYSGLFPIWKK